MGDVRKCPFCRKGKVLWVLVDGLEEEIEDKYELVCSECEAGGCFDLDYRRERMRGRIGK